MSSDQIITGYLQDLRRRASAPHTTEFTFRPALETLLESLAEHLQRPVSHVTAEPGRVTNSGAPDFIIYGQTVSNLIGYVETKDLGRDLDHLVGHDADQFERYKQAFPVWIYTNYLDFRLYENKELKQQVTLAHRQQVRGSVDLAELAASKPNELTTLFDRFFRLSTPTVTSAEDLAGLLAHKARLLEQVILSLMTDEQGGGELESQLEAYRRWLIPELSVEEFADFYAQTLTYGLFFAAYENSERSAPLAFTRGNALRLLPSAVRPIRAIFQLPSVSI